MYKECDWKDQVFSSIKLNRFSQIRINNEFPFISLLYCGSTRSYGHLCFVALLQIAVDAPPLQTGRFTQVLVAHLERSFINFQAVHWRNDRTISHLSFSARTLFYWQWHDFSLAAPVIYWDYDNVKCGDIYWHFLSRLTD